MVLNLSTGNGVFDFKEIWLGFVRSWKEWNDLLLNSRVFFHYRFSDLDLEIDKETCCKCFLRTMAVISSYLCWICRSWMVYFRVFIVSLVWDWNRTDMMSHEMELGRLSSKVIVYIDGAVTTAEVAQICCCCDYFFLSSRSNHRIARLRASANFTFCSLFVSDPFIRIIH